jgi:hypothetical protein
MGLIRFEAPPDISQGDALALRGDLTAVRRIDFQRLRQSLPPRIRSEPQILMVIEDRVTCTACSLFPFDANKTGIQAVLVTESAQPGDHPDLNTVVFKPGTLDGLPPEAYEAYPMALLIDFAANKVTVAPGQIPNWAGYLSALHTFAPYSTEKI